MLRRRDKSAQRRRDKSAAATLRRMILP